jgi:hypothetical protein
MTASIVGENGPMIADGRESRSFAEGRERVDGVSGIVLGGECLDLQGVGGLLEVCFPVLDGLADLVGQRFEVTSWPISLLASCAVAVMGR